MSFFLQNTGNVGKILDCVKTQNYEDLSRKYSQTFTDYDDNFDTKFEKDAQDKFEKKLLESLPKMKNFLLKKVEIQRNSEKCINDKSNIILLDKNSRFLYCRNI